MGLIKKYQTGNTMNVSFNNNDAKQQKLVKKQYDKNAGGLNVNNNSMMEQASANANEMFKPREYDFSSIKDKSDLGKQEAAMKSTASKAAFGTAASGLSKLSGIASSNAMSKVNEANSAYSKANSFEDIQAADKLAESAESSSKTAETVGKASKVANSVGTVMAIKGIVKPITDGATNSMDQNKYGETTNNAGGAAREWYTADSDHIMAAINDNKGDVGKQVVGALRESSGMGKILDIHSTQKQDYIKK